MNVNDNVNSAVGQIELDPPLFWAKRGLKLIDHFKDQLPLKELEILSEELQILCSLADSFKHVQPTLDGDVYGETGWIASMTLQQFARTMEAVKIAKAPDR